MRYENQSNINDIVLLPAQEFSSDAAVTTSAFEVSHYELGTALMLYSGAVTTGDIAITNITESVAVGGTYTNVAAVHLYIPGETDASTRAEKLALTLIDAANTVTKISYMGKFGFLKVEYTTANSAALLAGIMKQVRPEEVPVA